MKTAVASDAPDARAALLSQLKKLARIMWSRYRLGEGDIVYSNGQLTYRKRP